MKACASWVSGSPWPVHRCDTYSTLAAGGTDDRGWRRWCSCASLKVGMWFCAITAGLESTNTCFLLFPPRKEKAVGTKTRGEGR